jgi:hypothetical protein
MEGKDAGRTERKNIRWPSTIMTTISTTHATDLTTNMGTDMDMGIRVSSGPGCPGG